MCKIILAPCTVQGAEAPKSIISAIELLQNVGCDTIITGRGGGSIEDLWAFNDENLARCVYNSKIPVISAVGHETDFTICDFAADLRAPTPSAAAELAVPDSKELLMYISGIEASLSGALNSKLDRNIHRLKTLSASVSAFSPENRIARSEQQLENVKRSLYRFVRRSWGDKRDKLNSLISVTESLSPLKVLRRGYSMLTDDNGTTLSSVQDVKTGQKVTARLSDGILNLSVIEKIQQN